MRATSSVAFALMWLAIGGVALAGSDTQLWSEVKLTTKLGDYFDLIGANTLRFGEDISHHDRTAWQFGLNFHARPGLTFTPSYQYIANDPADDVNSFEHRISLVTAVRLPFERCEGTFSTGVEYRLRHEQANGWRVRPRLKLKRAFGPDKWGVASYVAEELFYDTRTEDWTRNRAFVGMEKKMRRNWVLELYYCRQSEFRGSDPDLNIVGVSMRLSADASASQSSSESVGD